MINWFRNSTVQTARRVTIAVVGATIVLVGIAMLVLPGPGLVVIGAGLAFLSIEFAFARRWLRYVRKRTQDAADKAHIPCWLQRTALIGGIVFGGVMMVVPGCMVVVKTPEGWEFIRRENFSYAHAITSRERLEEAAAEGDDGATRLLESVERRQTNTPDQEGSS